MPQPPTSGSPHRDEVWHSQHANDVLARLGSNAGGLTSQEVSRRLAADGPNELKEGARISPLRILLGQFKSLIIWILIVAGAVSAVLGEGVDAIAILTIVALNAGIGFYQEPWSSWAPASPQAPVRRWSSPPR